MTRAQLVEQAIARDIATITRLEWEKKALVGALLAIVDEYERGMADGPMDFIGHIHAGKAALAEVTR